LLSEDDDLRAQERVGSVLDDKWTLERLLGIGGMAAVYAARHRNGARAAVKMIHPTLSRHHEVCERFRREGYAANRVDHPSVVKVLDDDVVSGGPDAGAAYLVMELLEGHSLQDRLERGPPVSEREYLFIAAEVLEVLDAAHSRGVVHRDLKPENLFLLRGEGEEVDRPRVKVLDFGLARLLDGQTITTYGLALGTPSFMSPEQAAGRIDEIDGRTDLFALAATGFRLRTGRRIHEGANAVELVTKMAKMAAPRVHSFAPDASAGFARVVDRALEFRREDRYESAAAMRDDVRRAIAELDGNARTQLAVSVPPSRPPPASDATIDLSSRDLEVSSAEKTTRTLESKWPERDESVRLPKRGSALRWIALLLLVVGAGVGGKAWFGMHRKGSPQAPPTAPTAQESASASVPEVARDVPAHTIPTSSAVASSPPPPQHVPASPASAAPARTLPAPATPAATATRRAPPAKVGPGNVHKLRGGHHARRSTPSGAARQ
jgi:serine/threonine-protein kinase